MNNNNNNNNNNSNYYYDKSVGGNKLDTLLYSDALWCKDLNTVMSGVSDKGYHLSKVERTEYIHIVVFSTYRNMPGKIVYNVLSYPLCFTNAILAYYLYNMDHVSRELRGNHLNIVDKSLTNICLENLHFDSVSDMYSFDCWGLNFEYSYNSVFNRVRASGYLFEESDRIFFKHVCNNSVLLDLDSSEFVRKLVIGDYSLLKSCLIDRWKLGSSFGYDFGGVVSVNDIVVVTKDIASFEECLRDSLGTKLFNKGPIKNRSAVNSTTNFLSFIDIGIRGWLNNVQIRYNYIHRYHNKNQPKGSNCLPKKCFSFNNVHLNIIKSKRYYSTSKKRFPGPDISDIDHNLSNVDKKNFKGVLGKKNLFDLTYNTIDKILETQYLSDKKQAQIQIENLCLYQDKFFDEVATNPEAHYGGNSGKIMIEMKDNLIKTLNHMAEKDHHVVGIDIDIEQFDDNNYSLGEVSLVREIIKILGVEIVAKTLVMTLLNFCDAIRKSETGSKKGKNKYAKFVDVINVDVVNGEDNAGEHNDQYNNNKIHSISVRGIDPSSASKEFAESLYNRYIYNCFSLSDNNSTSTSEDGSEVLRTGFSSFKEKFKIHIKLKKNKDELDLSGNVFLHLGDVFLNLLVDLKVLEVKNLPTKTKSGSPLTARILVVPKHILKEFANSIPVRYDIKGRECLPMVYTPKKYLKTGIYNNGYGGYLLNDVKYEEHLIKEKVDLAKNSLLDDTNIVIDMINKQMSTPFKVNRDVLNFLTNDGVQSGLLSNFDFEAYNIKSDKVGKYGTTLEDDKQFSKSLLEHNILTIAKTFSVCDEIFFPLYLDFRGRTYCKTDFFDYQKGDLAKGLLLFAKPGFISKSDDIAISNFKAHGASMFGLSKESVEHRSNWVDTHSKEIINFDKCAPNKSLLNDAKDKFSFLAFCYEYRRFCSFMDNSEETFFDTYLPVQIDASCNGYQHLSMLGCNFNVARKLNLSNSDYKQKPDDFYSSINGLANEKIEESWATIPKAIETLESLLKNKELLLEKILHDNKNISRIDMYDKLSDVVIHKLESSGNKSWSYIVDIVKSTKDPDKMRNIIPKVVNIKDLRHEDLYIKFPDLEYLLNVLDLDIDIYNVKDKINLRKRDIKSCDFFKKVGLDRDLLKHIIMTESYGASVPTLIQKCWDKIKDSEHYSWDESKKISTYKGEVINKWDISFIVGYIRSAIVEAVPRVKNLSTYLRAVSAVCTKLNMAIPWNLPSGLKVYQGYRGKKEYKVSGIGLSGGKCTFTAFERDKYDLSKQQRAIRPNLVHSLDAATISLLSQKLSDKVQMYTVHDCFAVTADNVDNLIFEVKSVYVGLYADDIYIKTFDELVKNAIKTHIDEEAFTGNSLKIKYFTDKGFKTLDFPDVQEVVKNVTPDAIETFKDNLLKGKNL